MKPFRAFRIFNDDGRVAGRVVGTTLDELTSGEVVLRAAYSSVNYKDALAATGPRIIRSFPRIGGIDVSGTVVSSTDQRFKEGDNVIATSYDIGVGNDGGYAEYVRVPADWVVPLPAGLTLRESMEYGTAGFTAALAIIRLEHNGLKPGHGPVAVTGSTGGVGGIAISLLAGRGYRVTAITGKESERDYLTRLGAHDVLSRHTIQFTDRPIEHAQWAAAVDAAGGELLSWLVKTTMAWGGIASTGLTGGIDLKLSVIPFILRGVSLIGIDSVTCPMDIRTDVWRRLATDMKRDLSTMVREITLDGLPDAFATLSAGQARGRFVVRIGQSG
ncbi:MAG TPA: acryloyl-CoA reductase [Vicinamibacterales bacterium]|nr:acryloyl-CoA reductase [Vicinamibacterales bacterium]